MEIPLQQRTLAKSVSCAGVGVHSGRRVNLTLHPARPNHGIKFVRADLPGRPTITAHFRRVVDTSLATVLGEDGVIVSTVEHLMAALAGLGVDNALVELDNYEMPIMDGSAGPFAELILSAGIRKLFSPRFFFTIKSPIELKEGDRFVGLYPGTDFSVSCHIDFSHELIGKQTLEMAVTPQRFAREIAPARTFGFYHEVAYLKRFGLARGGSLDNAVVIGPDGIMNPDGLRYPDEFVRHKVLDCIGDFSLLGMPILGQVVAYRSGHAFHHAFLEKILAQNRAWEALSVQDMGHLSDFHPPRAAAI